MNYRLEKIFSAIPTCETFADIGCDHGYITKAMMDSGKCKNAIISDVSEKCLDKARGLLEDYIKEGRVTSVVSDGFDKVEGCDVALIAGMGGEEIVSILSKTKNLPQKLVLQPMKNPDKVRVTAVKLGYRIESDSVFFSGDKYYDLMVLSKGKDCLTADEIEFGRTNILSSSEDFKRLINERLQIIEDCLKKDNLSDRAKEELTAKAEKLKNYV